MEFDKEHKVIIDSMNEDEARAFIKFLVSERDRHWQDIVDCSNLIEMVGKKFDIDIICPNCHDTWYGDTCFDCYGFGVGI